MSVTETPDDTGIATLTVTQKLKSFIQKCLMVKTKTILIAGIGNDYRSDDGVGRVIARKIREWQDPRIDIRLFDRSGIELISEWKAFEQVYVIDAVMADVQPGHVFRFTVPPEELPPTLFCTSTHAFNLADVIRLAGTLNYLPRELVIYGIAIQNVEHGAGLTPPVQDGAQTVLQRISGELKISVLQEEKHHA